MKITAEFNSVEEVLNFANTFGKTSFFPQQEVVQAPVVVVVDPKEIMQDVAPKIEKHVDNTPKVNANIVSEEPPKSEAAIDVESTSLKEESKEEKNEEPKVTKEMVRERLGAAMKAGKQKEVKELVAKYGASKVPDLKEEDYAAVYKETEALL